MNEIDYASRQAQHIDYASRQAQHIDYASRQAQHIDYASRQAQHIDYDRCIQMIRSGKISKCVIDSHECCLISNIRYDYNYKANYDKLATIVQEANNNQINCTIRYSGLLSKLPNKFYQFVEISLHIYGDHTEKTFEDFFNANINCNELCLYVGRPQGNLYFILDYLCWLLEHKKVNKIIIVWDSSNAEICLQKIKDHPIKYYEKFFEVDAADGYVFEYKPN